MKCVVTGAAGFIGSHLCERLLALGHEVHGVDAFIPYYSPDVKKHNLTTAQANPRFHFHAIDLRRDPLTPVLRGAEIVFHLAAMPGLTRSWHDFDLYESCNVTATQRLLEALRQCDPRPRKLVHASTSSVYGRTANGNEDQPTRPISPYGVTKLAAENLVLAYADAFGLPVVILRYFSVYGPRQRPDMGYHQFIEAMLTGRPIVVTGDGHQVRGNTFIADCVGATIAAADAPNGSIYNVGGGESASVWDILRRLEKLAGRPANVQLAPARPGDQRHTLADSTRLARDLGWKAATSLDDGLAQQWQWQAEVLRTGSASPSHSPTS